MVRSFFFLYHLIFLARPAVIPVTDQVMEQYLIAGVVPQLKHLQASQDLHVQNLAYDIYVLYTQNRSRYNILSYSGYSVR